MKKTSKVFKRTNILPGLLYFYVHFVTEIICFYVLYCYAGDRPTLWVLFLTYDMLAFVPQGIIGYFNDKYPRLNLSSVGLILLLVALVLSKHVLNNYISLIVLCFGNCLIHVNGAEVTLRSSEGMLSGSAIFVAGGSFGVVTGRLLASSMVPIPFFGILLLSAIPIAIISQRFVTEKVPYNKQCIKFDYVNKKNSKHFVILIATIIVAIRGYMGYGIPASWNKTTVQMVLLYIFMGIGKALGGILSDLIGCKKTAIASTIIATPLIMMGDNHMMVSLVGVMFFSMTMAITLGLLVSVLPSNPGLAFGITTTGLFVGTFPIFFIRFIDKFANGMMLLIMSLLCIVFMLIIIKGDNKYE